jgi:hypothetical protein
MRRTVLGFAAMLSTFGAANADDFSAGLRHPSAGVISSRYLNGDAAPPSVVRKSQSGLGFSSTASIQTPSALGTISSRHVHGDAPLPSATANGGAGSFGYSSSAPMEIDGGDAGLATSQRALYGSN